jgi:hypothetical protein
VLRHRVIAVVMWLLAAFVVVWFVVVATVPSDHFLLQFCLFVALIAGLAAVVAVWALRPRLVRDRQRPRTPAPPPALDALGRPPVEPGEQPLDGELVIEASGVRRRVLTRGQP